VGPWKGPDWLCWQSSNALAWLYEASCEIHDMALECDTVAYGLIGNHE